MSYILDALRKSDQQRQRGATPTLLTAQLTAAEPRPSEHWIYGLIAVVLVGAGILIGWLHPWQQEQPDAVPSSGANGPLSPAPVAREVLAAKPPESETRQASPVVPAPVSPGLNRSPAQEPSSQLSENAEKPEQPVVQPAPASSPRARMTQDKPVPSPTTAEATGTAPKLIAPAPRGVIQTLPDKSSSAGSKEAAQEPRVMTMGELPPSILQELPSMQISLHLHSTKPANRFVSINNQMLQEGALVAPGLKLEQITSDGMIFSYKGYRFRRGVQ